MKQQLYAPVRDERPGILWVRLPADPNPAQWVTWLYDIEKLIEAGYTKAAIWRDNAHNIARYKAVDEISWEKLVEKLGVSDG